VPPRHWRFCHSDIGRWRAGRILASYKLLNIATVGIDQYVDAAITNDDDLQLAGVAQPIESARRDIGALEKCI
jgi:hypothetical protein